MSFLTDLFEGNFSNLGTDIVDAPSSLINHPDQLAETLGVGAAVAAPFVFPEIGAALGIGDAATGAATAADAATVGDAAIGADAATGGLAADAGIGDIASAAAADSAAVGASGLGSDLLAFAPDASLSGSALSGFTDTADIFGPGSGLDLSGGTGLGTDAIGAGTDTSTLGTGAGTTDAAATAATPAPATAATPAASTPGFAPTDAELTGGVTGTAPTTASASTGGGFTSSLNSIVSSPYTKLALAAAPLALTLGMGEAQLPSAATAAQAQALALQQQGLTALQQANNGQLNAGQTAQLGQMKSDLTNQWLQTLKNQGVQDPTKDARWPQIEAQIDAQVTQQTATLIQQNITNALQETGQASSALTSIANLQFQADQAFQTNLINATKSLGLVAGLSSGAKITIGS